MAHDIISTLDLDKESLIGKIILINETSGCDANFLFSCLMSKAIKEKNGICLVTVHNDFNHFNSIGFKLGYNLKNLKDAGSVINIDYLELVSEQMCEVPLDNIYKTIHTSILTLREKHEKICIIIDDLTNFLNLNFTIGDINRFVQKCRCIDRDSCGLIMGVHVIPGDHNTNNMSKLFAHMSDIVCEVSGLSTGRSADVSGSLRIIRPWTDEELDNANRLTLINSYLFKLFERGVKVFAPGTR